MKHLVATLVLGASLGGCSSPTKPSTVTVQGNWGGASRAQGAYRQTTCSATGLFATSPPGLGACDLAVGSQGRVGLSLTQTGSTISGTVFFVDGARAVTGTAQNTTLAFTGSWNQYPGDPNPVAAALVRTINWNGSVSGDTMTADFTIRDTFREGSGFSGAVTVGYQLITMTRD